VDRRALRLPTPPAAEFSRGAPARTLGKIKAPTSDNGRLRATRNWTPIQVADLAATATFILLECLFRQDAIPKKGSFQMAIQARLLCTLLAAHLVLVSSEACAQGAPSLDDELAKNGAARVIAESIMTDESYDSMLLAIAQAAIPALQNDNSSQSNLSVLARKDESRFKEAVISAMHEIAPKEFFVHALQGYFAGKLSYEDLRAAVAFLRSESGRRFWLVATNQAEIEKALDAESRRVDLDPDKVFEQQLKLRFPHDEIVMPKHSESATPKRSQ
jgi:hypothetical protein